MRYKGKIDYINHIVVSDPTYNKDVWCRYEKNDLDEKNWIVDLSIDLVREKVGDYIIKNYYFELLLKKTEYDCELMDGGKVTYSKRNKTNQYDIGIDTACISLGINEYAKEIVDSKEEYQPECSLNTGADGMFGNVLEGVKNKKINFILISGYFDESIIEEHDLLDFDSKKRDEARIVGLIVHNVKEHLELVRDGKSKYTMDQAVKDLSRALEALEPIYEKYDYTKLPKKYY